MYLCQCNEIMQWEVYDNLYYKHFLICENELIKILTSNPLTTAVYIIYIYIPKFLSKHTDFKSFLHAHTKTLLHTHKNIHTSKHTPIHTHPSIYAFIHTHTFTIPHTHHTHIQANPYYFTCMHPYSHINTYTSKHISVHIHKHPCTHIHTPEDKTILTRPFSMRFVIMTITLQFCSHTMRQKSANVCGNGPCVAM